MTRSSAPIPLTDPAPSDRRRPPISRRRAACLTVAPFAIGALYLALLAWKPTRRFAVRMTDENYPVEILTFLFLLVAAAQALVLSLRLRRAGERAVWRAFYFIFALLLFLTAMEEISWGQWFFHFHTPPAIERINVQHEFNLHNLKGMGGHTEFLRLTFGVGGLIGILLSRWRAFDAVSAPPRPLWAWFTVITHFAAADLFCDYHELDTPLAKAMDVMSEVVELMIALSAVVYLWIKSVQLRANSVVT